MNTTLRSTNSDTPRPRIEVRQLTKTFRRVGGESITPIDNVSLDVGAQEMMLLVGPSGCGKTTLLRCIAGLEKPDTGEIIIDGEIVFSSEKNIFVPPEHRRLSMIFQSYALWPHMSVFDNIAYPLESRKVAKAEIAPRVERAMQMVGVGNLGRQFPGRISGGQQQRVALARALVSDSKVVLFDEPLSNVDARVREQLRFEMKRMQRQLQFSGLYVTHDQNEAMELGDRIAVLEAGRVAAMGVPKDIYERPNSEYVAMFLGSANIWEAVVTGKDGRLTLLKTPSGETLMACGTPGDVDCKPGEGRKIVVRPEKITLSAVPGPSGMNRLEGVVTAQFFTGAFTEFRIACGELSVRALSAHDAFSESLKEGGKVHLTIDSRWVWLLPACRTSA